MLGVLIVKQLILLYKRFVEVVVRGLKVGAVDAVEVSIVFLGKTDSSFYILEVDAFVDEMVR